MVLVTVPVRAVAVLVWPVGAVPMSSMPMQLQQPVMQVDV